MWSEGHGRRVPRGGRCRGVSSFLGLVPSRGTDFSERCGSGLVRRLLVKAEPPSDAEQRDPSTRGGGLRAWGEGLRVSLLPPCWSSKSLLSVSVSFGLAVCEAHAGGPDSGVRSGCLPSLHLTARGFARGRASLESASQGGPGALSAGSRRRRPRDRSRGLSTHPAGPLLLLAVSALPGSWRRFPFWGDPKS